MKYCSSCKKIINADTDLCDVCNGKVTDVDPECIVYVTTLKGKSVSFLENVLKEEGVPCSFVKTEGDVYNELNAKVNAESDFRLLVPFEYYHKTFDICVGMGYVDPEDRLVPENEEEAETDTPSKSYNEKFEEKNGVKHRTWQMIWMIAFIIAACLVIWGIDWIAHFFNPYLR